MDALKSSVLPTIRLEGISKSFPGVAALSGVELSLYPGQVTALIGENGAGKSTLVKILTGIYAPDEGRLIYQGEPQTFTSAHAALKAGITAIHQETVLFDELSVAENIFIGHQPLNRFGMLDWRKMFSDARVLLAEAGAKIDPRARLRDLGIASRHLVAIARALSVDARVVIMDEPTAALSQKEIFELYELIEKLRSAGKAILFISHKFDEVFAICNRYTVFRDGKMIHEGLVSEVNNDDLVRMMVGRDVAHVYPKMPSEIGASVLRVDNYCHPTEFDAISFELRRGEILGFYGLIGAGRTELMQSLFGVTKPSKGTLEVSGKATSIRSASEAIHNGIVYVPEERGRQGAIVSMPIFQNVTLPSLARTSRRGFLQLVEEFQLTREYTSRLNLRAASLDQDVETLSGGNQQKVVIAKWLATKPKVIILDEPTKGIDIGSKAAVHTFMSELATQGLSVIMVSSEIPEILGMADRVIVMREGRIVAEYPRKGLTAETLLRAAAGIGAET